VRLNSADYTATTGTTVVLTSGATSGDTVTTMSFLVSSVLNAIPSTTGAVITSYILDANVTTAKIADANVTQIKLATGVAGTGPAFSAYLSANQTITASSQTKVAFNIEEFDTASCYNNTASTVGSIPAYSFLPNVAGYYQINVAVNAGTSTTLTRCFVSIFKNGSENKRGTDYLANTTVNGDGVVSAIIYCNGTTDYLEAQVFIAAVTAVVNGSATFVTYFQAAMIRSA
jgi:hypothetical protein